MSDYLDQVDALRDQLRARAPEKVHFASWNGDAWSVCDEAPLPGALGLIMGPYAKLWPLIRANSRLRTHCIFSFFDWKESGT